MCLSCLQRVDQLGRHVGMVVDRDVVAGEHQRQFVARERFPVDVDWRIVGANHARPHRRQLVVAVKEDGFHAAPGVDGPASREYMLRAPPIPQHNVETTTTPSRPPAGPAMPGNSHETCKLQSARAGQFRAGGRGRRGRSEDAAGPAIRERARPAARRRARHRARSGARGARRFPATRGGIAAAGADAGENPLRRHQLRQPQRRFRRSRAAEISQPVLPRARLAGRASAADRAAARIRATRLRSRDRAGDRPRKAAASRRARRSSMSRASCCATRAPCATGCATANST